MITSVMSTKYNIFCLTVTFVTILFSFILYCFNSSRFMAPENIEINLLNHEDIFHSKKWNFKVWRQNQEILKTNVKSVCKKYGKSLRLRVPITEFLYSSEDNLLFCKNAKVSFASISFSFSSIFKKVGTTSWLKNFLSVSSEYHPLLKTLKTNRQLHDAVPKLFKAPRLKSDRERRYIHILKILHLTFS